MARYDVIIIGGAIVGSSIAYYLREEGFSGSIALIERDPQFTHSSTTLSLASIRQQFSIPENIRLSQFTLGLFRRLEQEFGAGADIGFREGGYLILAGENGQSILEQNHAAQMAEGADIVLEDADALQKRFSWISTEGITAGAYGRSGEGWFDAHAMLMLFRKALREKNVDFIAHAVAGIEREGNRVSAVTLENGERLEAGIVFNAAGPSAGKVAAMAGLALPVEPRKRNVFVFEARDKFADMPLMVDPSGIYVRPEGSVYLAGGAEEEAGEGPADPKDFDPDWSLFEDKIWPVLATRVPAFEAIKATRAWAGHYDYNTLDQNAVIGPHPEVENFIFANGFSGHGLQQAPAVGKSLAELLVHGGYRTIDCSAFGYARIAGNRPFRELNVI
ncbi:FAD-dependent oxidoreductase domain-containing protein 1 [Mesorhizobium soli]|uniref:NAD(P)/FAD-dependent oxidoreductase n=1 Tax=Pseudaminobacter soli (ex Li et al. 2025) TaxID=1295366 RepID=UPI0024764AF7|nr:FAD-binding oxidoreductase [Mesorhizobium soli]MDH6231385.1 FAD-dependent oxidoreductase domain-containing protein 1 [Mesorhizobium soli]